MNKQEFYAKHLTPKVRARDILEAEKMLKKIMPVEKWMKLGNRSKEDVKRYKEMIALFDEVIAGENTLAGGTITTRTNGKTTVKFRH